MMKNLLVPVDFSDVTDRVVEVAADLAQKFNAKVWLLHCISQYPTIASMSDVPMVWPYPESELPIRFSGAHRQLSQLTTQLRFQDVNAEMLFVSGPPKDRILLAADQYQIDMIVMGSHGHGALYDLVVGSVANSVLHNTTLPTLIVPREVHKEKTRVAASQWEEPMATSY